MLPGTYGMRTGDAGSSSATLTYRGYKASSARDRFYNFTSQSLGTAAADRYVVCAIVAEGENLEPTSVSVGATTLTRIAGSTGGTGKVPVSLYGALVTAGTSATVAIVYSVSQSSCAVYTYTMTGLQSTTVRASASGTNTATNISIGPLTCDVGSPIIALVNIKETSSAIVWTGGVTENQEIIEANSTSSTSSGTATSGSETPVANWTTSEAYAYVAAAWS